MTAGDYSATGHLEDVCGVVGVSIEAFFEDPAVSSTPPRPLSPHSHVMPCNPIGYVEPLVLTTAGVDSVRTARLIRLHRRDFLQLLPADKRKGIRNLEDLRRTVRPLRVVVALLGDSAVELRYACCVLGRGVNLDRLV